MVIVLSILKCMDESNNPTRASSPSLQGAMWDAETTPFESRPLVYFLCVLSHVSPGGLRHLIQVALWSLFKLSGSGIYALINFLSIFFFSSFFSFLVRRGSHFIDKTRKDQNWSSSSQEHLQTFAAVNHVCKYLGCHCSIRAVSQGRPQGCPFQIWTFR